MKINMKGAFMATAIAGLFVAGVACAKKAETGSTDGTMTSGEMVKCTGVNECKGKGACGGEDMSNSCAGKNECKGKGWIKISKDECSEKGGKTM